MATPDPGRHQGVGASVVAGVDTTPVLEASEHDLNPVALAVERGVVREVDSPIDPL